MGAAVRKCAVRPLLSDTTCTCMGTAGLQGPNHGFRVQQNSSNMVKPAVLWVLHLLSELHAPDWKGTRV
jgi:hypothetical protein